jgi:hypothetical protein
VLRFAEISRYDEVLVVRGALPAEELHLVERYARLRLAAGAFRAEESASSALYGDPLGDTLLDGCTDSLTEILDRPLYPTYSYFRLYRPGAELPVHTDRASCDWTTSVALSRQAGTPIWPIEIEGCRSVDLEAGDCVVLPGRELPHARRPSAPGWSLWLLLHWSEDRSLIFDGRPSLGLSI